MLDFLQGHEAPIRLPGGPSPMRWKGQACSCCFFLRMPTPPQEIPRELALASKYRKTVIPARIEVILPSGALAYSITNAQFVDLFRGFEKAVDRLCASLAETMEFQRLGNGTSCAPAVSASDGNLEYGGSALVLLVTIYGGWNYGRCFHTATWQRSEKIVTTSPALNMRAAPNTSPPAV